VKEILDHRIRKKLYHMDWERQVHSLYRTALGRTPDQEGLISAVRLLKSGGSLDCLANQFVSSTEFRERHGQSDKLDTWFILTLYRDGLGRQPDQKSLAAWLKQRKKRGIRAKLLVAVAGSREALDRILPQPSDKRSCYARWIAANDTVSEADRAAIRAHIARLPFCPRISVIICGGERTELALRQSVRSLAGQLYSNRELCLGASKPFALRLNRHPPGSSWWRRFVSGRRQSGRGFIKIAQVNEVADTATAANAALDIATGDFVAFLRAGDLLPEHALYEAAVALCGNPVADIVYSDHDQIDESGSRFDPWFKPGWDPDLLLAHDYISGLALYRKRLLDTIGGLRSGFEGAELHELTLRATRATKPDRILHIPAILYHRKHPEYETDSQAAFTPSYRAVREHLSGRGDEEALLEPVSLVPEALRVVWPIPDLEPLVSVLIPTRDRIDLLARCLDGVLRRTNYHNLELLIVDNGSSEPATQTFLDQLERDANQVRILRRPGPFNYSALNNAAAREARGDILLLLNNDIEVIEPGWLRELVSHAIRPDVGIAGAKLLYKNGQVQHAGIVLGPKGAATHLHRFANRNDPGYFGDLALTRTLSAVTGACIAIRRALFFEAGGLDETDLQVAFNDVDLCLRVRQHGYRVIWTPFAELFHLELASRGLDSADPAKFERSLGELQHMRKTWGSLLDSSDPFHNPNVLFGWDFCEIPSKPRRDKPWWNYYPEKC
jgi:GT2 family glycosyltransferase